MVTNQNDDMKLFADNMWEYFQPMLKEQLEHNIGWFRATVVANNGDGTLMVQRPFDNPFTVKAVSSMAGARAGRDVLVFTFGSNLGTNAVVMGDADAKNIGGGGGGSITAEDVGQGQYEEPLIQIENGGTGARTAKDAHWALQRACYMLDSNSNWSSYAWHQIASWKAQGSYQDGSITFLVRSESESERYGILDCHCRTDVNGLYQYARLQWTHLNSGITLADYVVRYTNDTNSCLFEIWARTPAQWTQTTFTVLHENINGGGMNHVVWDLYNSNGNGSANYTPGTGGVVSVDAVGIVDGIVEEGSGYIKLENGLMIQWGTHTPASTAMSAMGNVYVSSWITANYPKPFVTFLGGSLCKLNATSNTGIYNVSWQTTNVQYTAWRGDANYSGTHAASWIAVGTWK